MQKITLKDIARKANVSVGLTSKALAGYSEVSQATQERIQRISRQMGYRPPSRRAAQEPADAQNTPRRLRRACLVFLNSKSSVTTYGQHWIRELSLAARQHDVRLEMSVIEPQPDDSSLREELRRCAQGVDGVMILGYLRTTMRDVIQSLDKPCVAIGNFEPGPRPVDHQVNNNNLEMAHLATRSLLEAGHRRIGLVTQAVRNPGNWNDQWRLGFRMALLQADMPDDPALRPVFGLHDRWIIAEQAARHIAALTDRPTAYLLAEIPLAVHFRHAMAQQGLPISPNQMVIGGDPEIAMQSGLGEYPLLSENAAAAASHTLDLLHRLTQNRATPPIQALVPCRVHNFHHLISKDMSCSIDHGSDASGNPDQAASQGSR